MKRKELEKYLNKNIFVFFDRTKFEFNSSKYFNGKLIDISDTSLTLSLNGCSYASEICMSLDVVTLITISKDNQ